MNNTGVDMLESSLQVRLLTPQSRLELVRGLWNRNDLALEDFQAPNLEGYFRYYQDQCLTALYDNYSQAKSHREVVNQARQLMDPAMDASRIQTLLVPTDNNEVERYWIFLAARILTMIDVGGLRNGVRLGQLSRGLG